jgi:hypothetical protein
MIYIMIKMPPEGFWNSSDLQRVLFCAFLFLLLFIRRISFERIRGYDKDPDYSFTEYYMADLEYEDVAACFIRKVINLDFATAILFGAVYLSLAQNSVWGRIALVMAFALLLVSLFFNFDILCKFAETKPMKFLRKTLLYIAVPALAFFTCSIFGWLPWLK